MLRKYLVYLAIVSISSLLFLPGNQTTKIDALAKPIPSKNVVQANVLSKQNISSTAILAPQQPTPPSAPIQSVAIPQTDPVSASVLTPHESIMSQASISSSDFTYVNYIVSHESGWCATKWEGEVGYCPSTVEALYNWSYPYKGYGLCQSTPAIKMSSIGSDWTSNPVTQMEWCNSYAVARYGSWYNAYQFWIANNHW